MLSSEEAANYLMNRIKSRNIGATVVPSPQRDRLEGRINKDVTRLCRLEFTACLRLLKSSKNLSTTNNLFSLSSRARFLAKTLKVGLREDVFHLLDRDVNRREACAKIKKFRKIVGDSQVTQIPSSFTLRDAYSSFRTAMRRGGLTPKQVGSTKEEVERFRQAAQAH